MRVVTRMILPLLLIVGIFLAMVFMLAQSVRMEYADLAALLAQLRHDQTALSKSVLRAGQSHHENVSSIVEAKSQLASDAQKLFEMQGHDGNTNRELDSLLDAYLKSVVELLDHVEQFKTANAVEQNSLHSLPQLVDATNAVVPNEQCEIRRAVDGVSRTVLVYIIESSPSSRDDVIRQIADLTSLQATAPAAVSAQLELLKKHVAKLLEMQPAVAAQIETIVSSPADQYLAEALVAVAGKKDQAGDRQRLFQLVLIVVAATLIGFVGALLWQLRRSVRELDTTNQSLEKRIESRVAELKAINQQLLQAQKLESIGQLAAGIAHEINTPMQFISDNIEYLRESSVKLFAVLDLCQKNLRKSGEHKSWDERWAESSELMDEQRFERIREQVHLAIAESLEGSQRVISIVRAMKEFSHPGSNEMVFADLNKAIQSTVTITRNNWKYSAEVILELDATLPPVLCLPAEINQAMLNLVVNAADAITDSIGDSGNSKGTITIRTRREGSYVAVEVEDTGCGIPDEIRNRIFDPFFTTKQVGKGSGQGLAICYNVIVNKHHGTIELESKAGVGTRFTLKLPLGDDALPSTQHSRSTTHPSVEELNKSDLLEQSLDNSATQTESQLTGVLS